MIRSLLIVLAFVLATASLASAQTVVCQDGVCRVVRTPVRNVVAASAAVTANTIRAAAPAPILLRQEVPVLLYDMQTRQIRPWRVAVRERVARFFERLRRPFLFRRLNRF